MFAISAVALLAVIGLLYSFGIVLGQRRSLQSAADAASLSGAWQLLSELQSDDRSDANVQSAVLQYASRNGVTNPADVSFVYLRADSSEVARAQPFPTDARGVKVTISGRPATVLPSFIGASSVLVQTSASALGRPTASPTPNTQVLPIGISQTNYSAHAQIDLLTGTRLDLRAAGAPSYADMGANLQFWSDGDGANGSVAVGATLPVVSGSYNEYLAAGLADNVRRQNLRDASGAQYALVTVPILENPSSSPVRVVGFTRVKLHLTDIGIGSARGLFVPYAAAAYGTPSLSAPDFGAFLVGITQ